MDHVAIARFVCADSKRQTVSFLEKTASPFRSGSRVRERKFHRGIDETWNMKIIEPGHVYQLQHFDGTGSSLLVFVNREPGTEHEGTQTQEVLRALIDRTQHCDQCLRWAGNDTIIEHLRMALVLHEARALERKTQKGQLQPENVSTASDGHFKLE